MRLTHTVVSSRQNRQANIFWERKGSRSSFLLRSRLRQDVQKRGLPRPGSTTNKDGLAVADLFAQIPGESLEAPGLPFG